MPEIKMQFRALYREFLFRAVDLELLSQQADLSRLLGQFAALLIFVGLLLSVSTISLGNSKVPRETLLMSAWGIEHLLIATTMLVVGLFAVLGWDSIFPDRRDVLVLGPLPVQLRIIFLAKVTATTTALCVTILSLNVFAGITLPLALSPSSSGLLDLIFSKERYRLFAAYWATMAAAGAFVFCSVLAVQGTAALLLPRRQFLKLSAFLQMAAFCLFICLYFLRPSFTPENQAAVVWFPSYWFLGLFQQLNGSMQPVMIPLARRAAIGSVVVLLLTVVVYALSYFRTLRKIVEQPDILPGSRSSRSLPRFGDSLSTAIIQFSIRALMRSRQHRVTLAFYLGVGFALVILFMKTPHARTMLHSANIPLIFSSFVMMLASIVGTRIVFSMPLNLWANWIFRITEIRPAADYFAVIRRSLFVVTVVPVWLLSAVFFLSIWPWNLAVRHITVAGLWGTILGWLSLYGFQKIPFTCSWQPGKSYFHMAFLAAMGILLLVARFAELEWRVLSGTDYFSFIGVLVVAAGAIRQGVIARGRADESIVQFEDMLPPALQELGLR